MEILLKVFALIAGIGVVISAMAYSRANVILDAKAEKISKICIVCFAALGVACLVAIYSLFGWEGFLANDQCNCGCPCCLE